MTDKPEGPAKDVGRADATAQKRPHATIEVKATDVTPPEAKTPQSAQSAGAATSPTAASMKPTDKASEAKPVASATASTGAGPKGASSSASPAPSKANKPEAEPSPAATTRSGRGGFFSHLASGIIGGGLVYAATAYLPPDQLPFSHNADLSAKLEQRLKALESAGTATDLKSAEARLEKLESLAGTVSQLAEQTQRAEADANAAVEKAATGAATAQHITKLEERLDVIARSATSGDNRVPQLAAITGKIADLEVAVSNQLGEVRKAVPLDLETRLATLAEAAETAKSSAQRVDRELSAQRTETARLAQRDEAQKAESDRLAAAVQAAKEEAGKLSAAVSELRGIMAKPADVSAAVSPVASKLASLERSVATVVKSEEDRKSNAERIVLALELGNLKRAIDRGQGYAAELAEVRNAAAGRIDLAILERNKETGVPTLVALEEEFRPLVHAVIEADADPGDGSLLDRFWAGARSVVRVRKVNHEASDTSAEAVVARMEEALKAGNLGTVLEQAKGLSPPAVAALAEWQQKVAAKSAVDRALAEVESQLKASLSGSTPAPAGTN